ncbi:MAG: histidine kinase dimerization/phosphoacceptor domain -containing protein [Desulfococcaceae bacterium]|jgi:PAS domain S-box-containing protein|nr:histidine kinase dimerization/phosphoacceptor domain -containing protein [Desulfococcaceae bacterium]
MKTFEKLRARAENLLKDAESKSRDFAGYDLKNLINELDVYRIELELQNEELREARSDLELSRQEFSDLFDFAPIAYAVLDEHSNILRINRAGASLFGTSGTNLKGMRLSSFVMPPGIPFFRPFQEVLSAQKPETAEVQFVGTGQIRFWAQVDFSAWTPAHAPGARVLCAMRDISLRKSVEQEVETYHLHLEEMIRSRTKELEESNRRLREEICIRRQSEERLTESNQEKEVLLREIHHRVKNNMQVIISLLRLQSRKIQGEKPAAVFIESQERIRVMAMIHETLYRQKSLAHIDLADYLGRLVRSLIKVYARPGLSVRPDIRIGRADEGPDPDMQLNIDQAVPCGLIVNELISNALKYAFPNQKEGEIRIRAEMREDRRLELRIEDNGCGMPEDTNLEECESMGLKTVMILARRQLGGRVHVRSGQGTAFRICFTPDSKARIGQK